MLMIRLFVFRNVWLGLLSWLIPFAVSFFCYTPEGKPIMEYGTFKSLMTVIGAVSGSFLLYHFFKAVDSRFIFSGFVIGFSWFFINVLLDSIALVPMMNVSFFTYFLTIGLSYISIPAISIAMGYLLDRKRTATR
jgi:hypothetical protein